MPFKPSLRAFLRQEVKRSRIQVEPALSDLRTPSIGSTPASATLSRSTPVTPGPNQLTPRSPGSFFEEDSARGSSKTQDNDVDGLCGELMTEVTAKPRTKEERLHDDLEKLLSYDSKREGLHPALKENENLVLLGLRKKLEKLVDRDMEASWEEKVAIRGQRSELIRSISRIESVDKKAEAERLRATSTEAAGLVLPEPVGANEKKALLINAEKISQARAGLEVSAFTFNLVSIPNGTQRSPPKRSREDDERDLDGEDLLRLGKRVRKRPATYTTGHWKASIHDYFPGANNDGRVGKLEGLTAEKQLLRRELAELGENLAKAERKKKKLLC
ncbi:hypothetical protein B2J93_7463 [Marssonina coronariae]|uniref:Uncharacterized protein n=1 Tax=Diplocarpon coronariae TaxID=2795749 RepID=A0A218Z867_9HELO|nr:hypothetical protein B2J93_7463 [Marssonina coronariae]